MPRPANGDQKSMNTSWFSILRIAVVAASVSSAEAAYVFTGSTFTVTEDFNGLSSANVTGFLPSTAGVQVAVTGTGFDAVKLLGTGTTATALTADTGAGNSGGVYSYGAASNSERALGTLASGTTIPGIGFELQNGSGLTITELSISFTQENWRSSTTTQNVLTAGYGTTDTGLVPSSYLSASTGVTAASSLNLTGPTPVPSPNGALNGNNAGNQTSRSFTITGLLVNPGESFFLRWQDVNEGGNDAGLAIDGLSIDITAVGAPVPEPSTYAGFAGALLLGFGVWRRSRRS
jgi:hypothetical protein